MKPFTKRLSVGILVLGMVWAIQLPASAETLQKPAIERLVALQARSPSKTFADFADRSVQTEPALQPVVGAWQRGVFLSADHLATMARLLGIYSRVQTQADVIASLERMVALPTFRAPGTPPHESPAIQAFGRMVETMANKFGLEYRNVDNRVFEVRLRGSGPEELGLLTHCDVVPVTADEWVLPDGKRLDPFRLTRVGGLLYGRGSIDDKGSIASVLYAMKAVKDSGLPLARTVRLMIETTEESGGDGMLYYRERVALPPYNIVLDSRYPAVTAEKGTGTLKVVLPLGAADPGRATITAMAGAASASAIPQTASATLEGGDAGALAARLEAAKAGFIAQFEPQGGKFGIAITHDGRAVTVKVTGVSAHGSRPEEGVNPLPRLALFLQQSGVPLAANGYAQAVDYLTDLYGVDYLGRTMDLAYRDDFMGPLTMSPTMVQAQNGQVEVSVNVRMPRGRSPEDMMALAKERIARWSATKALPVTVDYRQGNWMARDPKGAWLQTLLGIFGDVTGQPSSPTSTAGSTTAKLMPNAINFGPAMPGKKYTAHNANEFKEIDDLDLDMQLFTEMLVRLGNLAQME